MKRVFSAMLILCLTINLTSGMFPTTATAATIQTSESEPVYLGTEAEYKTTFNTMFDENGLRKVSVGYNSNDGVQYEKVGMVNKYGEFVIQPIYDSIKFVADSNKEADTTTPYYFLGGYTQAVRDGKMGLLNTKGEEVVPCQYDFVGLPSEGISRVYKHKKGDDYYLGYWNIEKNKEIVAPNKYITTDINSSLGYIENLSKDGSATWKKETGDGLKTHDFNGEYAMVFVEKLSSDKSIFYRRATIIDKNGKDILGKTYLVQNTAEYQYYAQKGPYLSFVTESVPVKTYKSTPIYKAWQKNDAIQRGDIKLIATDLSGLAGPEGIIIPATYGEKAIIKLGESTLSFTPARFEVFPDTKLILTANAINPVIEIKAPAIVAKYGLINFKGKMIIPFESGMGDITYDYDSNVFMSFNNQYSKTGKLLSKHNYWRTGYYTHGYSIAEEITGDYSQKYNDYPMIYYAIKADGTTVNMSKVLGIGKYQRDTLPASDYNSLGYIWYKKGNKYGLLNFNGKTILPFVYDEIGIDYWSKEKNSYAVVTKNGKQGIVNASGKEIVACSYLGFADHTRTVERSYDNKTNTILAVWNKNGTGLVNIATGKIIVPLQYDSVNPLAAYRQRNYNYYEMGVYYANKNNKYYLLDKNGKEIFSTKQVFFEALNGLYYYKDGSGSFDSKGRMIIPKELYQTTNLEILDSFTIYVKNKKVYRVSANYLKADYKYKMYTPSGKISSKNSATINKFAKSRAAVHKDALKYAKENPYQIKAIYKNAFVSFRSVPNKVTYKLGEAFDLDGFKAVWVDVYGYETDISNKITFDVNGTKIYDGYKFTTAGSKTVNCSYEGKKLNTFKISVLEKDAVYLEDGDYYITIYDKYLTMVDGRYIELSDKKPSKAFTVQQLFVDEDGYFIYKIMYDGGYLYQPSSKDGAQLMVSTSSGVPHQWRIAQYSKFWTIRDAGNQKLIVNASGESSKNGTKVIVWSSTGSAPDNAKMTFIKAK